MKGIQRIPLLETRIVHGAIGIRSVHVAYTKHDKAFCAGRIQGRFELDLITGAGCFIRANNDECRSSWFLERNALYYPANFPWANTWLVCTVNYTKVFPYRVTGNHVSLHSPLDTTLIPLSPSLNSDTIPPPPLILFPLFVQLQFPISNFFTQNQPNICPSAVADPRGLTSPKR